MTHGLPTIPEASRRRARRPAWFAPALVALVLSGCSGGAPGPAATVTDTSTAAPVGTPDPAPEAVELPGTAVGTVAAWLLELLNGPEDVTAADVDGRFAEGFTREVGADDLAALLNNQLRPAAPYVPTSYEGAEDQAVVRLHSDSADPLDMSVALDRAGLIAGLLFAPAVDREPATSLDEVTERAMALPADVGLLVRVDGDTVAEIAPNEAAPLGSVVKLYVLGAVVEAVDAGDRSWDDERTITPEVRSLPSGVLQDTPDGARVTVREAAQGMIEISDNTATDLLVRAVGREQVEATVERFGHHDPALLQPLLTTKDLFELAWGTDRSPAARWADGDEQERRALLASIDDGPLTADVASVTAEAVWTDGLDWFASPDDVVAAHLALDAMASEHPQIHEILGANPGIEVDPDAWPYVGYKGGNSIGVLAGSWIGQDADGRRIVVVAQVHSENPADVDASAVELFGLAEDVFALLG
ncbi:MAG: serine hydrolase [Cellulomonadaceae bacterium]